MHDNFEKEVQQKMEELRLTPSAPVWEKVEIEIRVKKKRRRGIFWLLFAGLLLSGGWWAYNSWQRNSQRSSTATSTQTPAGPATGSSKTIPPTIGKSSFSADTILRSSISKQNKQPLYTPSILPMSSSQVKKIAKRNVARHDDIITEEKKIEEAIVYATDTVTSLIKEAKTTQRPEVQKPLEKIKPEKKSAPVPVMVADSLPVETKPLVTITDSLKNTEKQIEPAVNDSSLKRGVAVSKKWYQQININIGRSSHAYGLIFEKSLALRDYGQASGLGGGPVAAPPGIPSAVSGGLAFSAGYHLSKPLSQRIEVSLGINYSYYSTKIIVGDKKMNDTVINSNQDKALVNELYTNTGKQSYTNSFHVIELPVAISFQASAKLPLFISAGLAYGYLVSTNALSFSSASNLYYKDDRNYTRSQVPLSASVQYRFTGKKAFSVQAGPVIRYNLLPLQKEEQGDRPHLFFAGLKTDIRF